MRRPAQLDFGDHARQAGWQTRLFLLLALALFAFSLAHHFDMTEQQQAARERLEQVTAGLKQQHAPRPPSGLQGSGEKQALIEASINLEWDEMLATIEHAMTGDVAITAIQTDPKKHSVSVTGQARNYPHILAFIKRLGDGKTLSNAYLASHAVVEDDPDQPVDFVVEATWNIH